MLALANFPFRRARRTRSLQWIRDLTAESHLSAKDLIWPIFVMEGENQVEDNKRKWHIEVTKPIECRRAVFERCKAEPRRSNEGKCDHDRILRPGDCAHVRHRCMYVYVACRSKQTDSRQQQRRRQTDGRHTNSAQDQTRPQMGRQQIRRLWHGLRDREV